MKRFVFVLALLVPFTLFTQIKFDILDVGSDKIVLEIKNQTKNDIELFISLEKFKKTSFYFKELLNPNTSDKLDYSKLKPFPGIGNFLSKVPKGKVQKFEIFSLEPKREYYIYAFQRSKDSVKVLQSFLFNTLAEKPSRQASQLAFSEITDTSIVMSWLNGNGEGRIVVIGPPKDFSKPKNGTAYPSSQVYGKESSKLGNCYVVYDGKDLRPKITISNLKPATQYQVSLFEYNGNGNYRHYNFEQSSNNPRVFITKISTPKIISIDGTQEETWLVRWEKVNGAKTYILDLALDKEFKELVESYQNLDVGDLGEFELSDLKPRTKYFVRLKAKGEHSESAYSPVFEFQTK
ncbi:MAG: fibronectin type III domain-containing protein [Ignavibacteria bacterium]|nr:fibronectin type III domain-containing protein [Ignavibacteria bacterium]